MKSGPFSVKHGDVDVREAARAAARRAGMTLGEWLEDAVAERAARLRLRPEELDEAERIEAVAVRLGALPLDASPPRRRASRADAAAPTRARQPSLRLLDAAAARLNGQREGSSQVAQNIAELERALGRRTGARAPASRAADHRLRRIADSLLDADEDSEIDHRAIESRIERLERPTRAQVASARDLRDEIEPLREQLQELSRAVVVIGERATKQSLEPALLDLLSRIEASRQDGVSDEALAPVMRTLIDIRDALENSPAVTARALRDEMASLHKRLDAFDRSSDAANVGVMRHQMETLARSLAELVTRMGGQNKLQGQISQLTRRVEEIAAAPREMIEQFAGLVSDLRAKFTRLDSSQSFQSLEKQIGDLAYHRAQDASALAETMHGLRESIDNLSEHPAMRAMQMQLQHLSQETAGLPPRLAATLDDLRATIEVMAGNTALNADLSGAALPTQVAESLAEIRLSLERLAANAGVRLAEDNAVRLQSIEDRVVAISEKLETQPLVERIEGLQETLLARMDRLRSDTPNAQIAALQSVVENVEKIVTNPKANEAYQTRIDELVTQVASRLERANAVAHNPRALQAIENQVLRIAERLDRQGESSDTLSSLERHIGELVSRVSETRAGPNSTISEAISRDLSNLRALQAEADRRTRLTLEAVHETLQKVVDRLAMLESDGGGARSAPARADVPAVSLQAMDGTTQYAPSRQDMAVEMSKPRVAQQSFIAAARRATQMMGAPPPPPRMESESADASSGREKFRIGPKSRKALLGVAGLAIGAAAWQASPPLSPLVSRFTHAVGAIASNTPKAAQKPQAGDVDATAVSSIARPAQGLDVLREIAEGGNAPAQYELASRLVEGRDTARDPAEAVRWLQKSAAQNYPPAQYRLAGLYEKGAGVERSVKEAMQWYTKAAQSGHVRAMHNLGVLLADGAEDRPDYVAAAAMFRRAADHGLRDSQYNFASLASRGFGTELNLIDAYKYFSLAGADGDADALSRRDEVAAKMLQKEIDEARRAVETFALREPDANANVPATLDAIIASKRANAPAPQAANGRKIDARVTSLK